MTIQLGPKQTVQHATPDKGATFTELVVHDVRFPTSLQRDGSDAMHPFPDYSAAYLELRTSAGESGYSLVFTLGQGNDVQCATIAAFAPIVVGLPVDEAMGDPGTFARRLIGDSQLRWLGPEKGAIHMAAGAVVNAFWDLASRRAGLPLWQLLSQLPPEQIVSLVDFRYLRDALTEADALTMLRTMEPTRRVRVQNLLDQGYPAYTTTPGWLGYDDARLRRLCTEAVADGYQMIKLKVGADLDDDRRRLRIAREAVGPLIAIAVDANQVWGVDEAIAWVRALAEYHPYWIEEPTSPDDVLGHAAVRAAVAPVRVATGEHAANAVMFKQLFQASAVDVAQIDACRVGGVGEIIAIILLAARFGIPVCPHAGGVGLCEMVQHLAMFDYIAVSGTWQHRYIEYSDHLHEHFEQPATIDRARYVAPTGPGAGARMLPASVRDFSFPGGTAWR